MTEVAEAARGRPDARVRAPGRWVRAQHHGSTRVLIFTEYADTKRYLEQQLRAALTPGRDATRCIATFHGGMADEAREESSAPSTPTRRSTRCAS